MGILESKYSKCTEMAAPFKQAREIELNIATKTVGLKQRHM